MTAEEIFNIWAPPSGIWSPWVKPVLFAHMNPLLARPQRPHAAVTPVVWPDAGAPDLAMVIDLPEAAGVELALGLAQAGCRPVPLYNAVPGRPGAIQAVTVAGIVNAILDVTPGLAQLTLADHAPPAFLLDANRRGGVVAPRPGQFDNRSLSFMTDFPSTNLLLSRGIRRALLVQSSLSAPAPDLAHTLRRWQQSGIALLQATPDATRPPVPLDIGRPSFWGEFWHRLMVAFSFRRNPLGGYGARVPEPSSG